MYKTPNTDFFLLYKKFPLVLQYLSAGVYPLWGRTRPISFLMRLYRSCGFEGSFLGFLGLHDFHEFFPKNIDSILLPLPALAPDQAGHGQKAITDLRRSIGLADFEFDPVSFHIHVDEEFLYFDLHVLPPWVVGYSLFS